MKHLVNGGWTKSIVVSILGLAVVLPLFAGGCSSARNIMTRTERISKPEQGKALVTFVRPSVVGGAIAFGIWDGDNLVGVLMPGKCIQYQTTPGEHYFMARAENWSCVKANLAPDKQYVIKANPAMGVWKARVAFDPVTEANYKNGQTKDAKKWITTLTPVMPDPSQREAYSKERRVQALEAQTMFKSGKGRFETMGPQDSLPE